MGIIGILWEFLEKLSDIYFGWRFGFEPLVASFSDSIQDLIMNIAGGMISLGIIPFWKGGKKRGFCVYC